MVQMQLINSVMEWERRLEFEEERRKSHRCEPYVNYLAAPQPCREGRTSIFARSMPRAQKTQEPCRPGCGPEFATYLLCDR